MMTIPTIAYVRVFCAELTLSGFPPEVKYLNPPKMRRIKNTIPAKERMETTIFWKIHSNPLMVATPFTV